MAPSTETLPRQHQQRQPGLEAQMTPRPQSQDIYHPGSGKLAGKTAIITGGDSGIGRAVALAFAQEGADLAILYLNERQDAEETQQQVEQLQRKCHVMAGDIADEAVVQRLISTTMKEYGKIDVLVNNAGEQHVQADIQQITRRQLVRTFETNFFGLFLLTKASLVHMRSGSAIINTASVTAYRGNKELLDYSASKGAIVAFTRSLALQVAARGIRVNAVAPGPVWTPLIPSTFDDQTVSTFGSNTPMGRPGQPEEIAPSYVFLASDDASYMTGQVLHPGGGEIVNG